MPSKQTKREGAGVRKVVGVPSAMTAVDQEVSGDSREPSGYLAAMPPKQREAEKKAGAKKPV